MIRLISFSLFLISSIAQTLAAQEKDTVYIRNFSTKDFKTSSINYTGITDENGILFFANENGVLTYDGSEWRLIPITDFGSTFSIHQAPNGVIYVGGNNEFGYLEPHLNSFRYISLRHAVSSKINLDVIWQIDDLGESIYFASYMAIVRYEKGRGNIINIDNGSIFKANDQIFVSRFDDGIYSIKEDSTYLFNNKYQWKNDNVYSSLPSLKDSSYLLYTSENGIYSFFPEKNVIEPYHTSNDAFLDDSWLYNGQIWNDSLYIFSTWYKGFFMMDKNGQIIKTINAKNGLLTDSYQDFILDSRNNIWSTSTNGISYIQWANSVPDADFVAKTIITEVNSDYVNEFQIRKLEFKFATRGYDKSDLDYSFYLEGYENDFGPWTDDVKKEYTNLSSGNYRFYVKARLPSGKESAVAQSQLFSIPTPWFKKPFFIVFGLVLLVGLVLLFFKLRTIRLRATNKQLENLVEKRTHELLEQREQLKKANDELTTTNKELDNFVYRSSHDLIAPLKSIKGLISLAERETAESTQLDYLSMMNKSVIKLEEFIRSIMDYSVNSKQERVKQTVLLDSVIESIKGDLKYFDNSEQVALIKNYDLDFTLTTDEKRLNIVLSNLIANCVKYHNYQQENPFVEVNVTTNEKTQSVVIAVTDNGIGIKEKHIEKVFDMFFRAAEAKNQGSGLGLYIVKDTVLKLDGEITVKSTIGQGTTFTVKLNEAFVPITEEVVQSTTAT